MSTCRHGRDPTATSGLSDVPWPETQGIPHVIHKFLMRDSPDRRSENRLVGSGPDFFDFSINNLDFPKTNVFFCPWEPGGQG